MKQVTFTEFNNMLLEELNSNFPNTLIVQLSGGDYLKDFQMELKQANESYKYSPYELYSKAEENNNYEEVLEVFINNWKDITSTSFNNGVQAI